MDKNQKRAFLGSMVLVFISAISLLYFFSELEARIYGTISGKVIAEDTRRGVEGATVLLFPYDERAGHPTEPLHRTTDKEGNFKFDRLRDGKYLIAVEPPPPYYGDSKYVFIGKYDKVDKIILKKGGVVYDLVKVVRAGGSISGRILKRDGTGHAGAWIHASTYGCGKSSETLSDGKYRIEGLMPHDDYKIEARITEGEHPLYCNEWSRIRKGIKIEAKKETKDIDLIMDLDDPTGIEGTVTSLDGKPLEGVIISVKIEEGSDTVVGGQTFTNGEGRYSMKGLASGSGYILAYFAIDYKNRTYKHQQIYISKGRKLKVDFVLDIKERKETENFFQNEKQSEKVGKSSILSQSSGKYSDPKIIIGNDCSDLESYELEVLKHDTAIAYLNALNLINQNCSKGGIWTTPDRSCMCNYGRRAAETSVTINVYCKGGCYGYGDDRTKSISLVGGPKICGCAFTNLVLHELLHVGGSPPDGNCESKLTEACANLNFDKDCRFHRCESKKEDCCCEK